MGSTTPATSHATGSHAGDDPFSAGDLAEQLRATILFSDLEHEHVAQIAGAGKVPSMPRGVTLFEQGDEPHECLLVISGSVAVLQESTDGRESLLSVLREGQLFGELGFLDGYARSAHARTLEDSEILAVPYEELRRLYESNPQALWSAVRLLASRLRATDEALSDTMSLDVMGRTAKRLLEMAADADEFEMTLTQEELASMIGASRERVNRAIHAFVKLGWISRDQRKYKILQRHKLSARAR